MEELSCRIAGQYKGHVEKPTIILEVVASNDLWIWHAFFGMLGLIMISMCFIGLLYLQT
jgi:hypothetical protein